VFNIGSGCGIAVGAFANQAMALAGHQPAFADEEMAGGNGFWADIGALRSLGWVPGTNLQEGLRRTLAYYTASC